MGGAKPACAAAQRQPQLVRRLGRAGTPPGVPPPGAGRERGREGERESGREGVRLVDWRGAAKEEGIVRGSGIRGG